MVGPPCLGASPGLGFESPVNSAEQDLMIANDVPRAVNHDSPPSRLMNQTLSLINERLALENELLKRQCAQKQMVEAMCGRAAYEMNMRAVAAGAFPNPAVSDDAVRQRQQFARPERYGNDLILVDEELSIGHMHVHTHTCDQ